MDHILTTNIPEYVSEKTGVLPPLGIMYVASYLKQFSDHSVDIIDCLVADLDHKEVAEKAIDYDVVGITTITFFLVDVVKVVQEIKKLRQDIKIVIGGPHTAIYPAETLQIDGVDFVLTGESEQSFALLVDTLAGRGVGFDQIPGLYYFDEDNQLRVNPPGKFIENLDELPMPDRTFVDYQAYDSILSQSTFTKSFVTTMFSSRGCPYKCIFCDRPNLGKSFRYHSPERIVAEIEHCVSLGIREIFFYDDTFTVNKQRVIDICDLIIERGINISWDIRARVNDVDLELLQLMKKAGCSRVHFGVEAGSKEMMKVLKKGISKPAAVKAFKAAKKAKIDTLAYFMIGCPGETREQMLETIDFAIELNPDYAHFSILTPFPGTPVYLELLTEGHHDYWQDFSLNPDPTFSPAFLPNTLPREELIDLLTMAYRKFYLRPSYLMKMGLRVRSFSELIKKISIAFSIFSRKYKKPVASYAAM
jgi:radical SAM superfamily enzyme YgiQ (UPF0313 family)